MSDRENAIRRTARHAALEEAAKTAEALMVGGAHASWDTIADAIRAMRR